MYPNSDKHGINIHKENIKKMVENKKIVDKELKFIRPPKE